MFKRLILTIASITSICSTAHASELDCLTRIIHAESRGESVEAVAITAQAAINRAEDGQFCALIQTKHRTQKYCTPCAIRRKLETRRNWSKA